MNEAKFVPGPWKVFQQIDHDKRPVPLLIVGDKEGDPIATVHGPYLYTFAKYGNAINQPMHSFNANLISAAPELYNALKELLFNSLHGNGLEAQYKTIDKAKAAIAKVEGE